MSSITRRKFLKRSAQLAAFTAAAKVFPFGTLNALAQTSEDYRALVCVFLFGGNDSDNTIVPIDGQARVDYDNVRSSLGIPAASLLPIGSVNHSTYGNTTYGFHPNLTGLQGLTSNMAIVANMGNLVEPLTKAEYRARSKPRPRSLFSHSDQQNQMQTARPLIISPTGWGGRVMDSMAGVNAPSNFPMGVSVSGSTLFLTGANSQVATLSGSGGFVLRGPSGRFGDARKTALQELLTFDTGLGLVQQASTVLTEGLAIGDIINNALETTNITTVFPNSSLGRQMKQVAQLIEARAALGIKRQIFFCSTGGFDTHSDQPGRHQSLMTNLSEAVTAFYQATQELTVADKVTTFTESDFGRTFQPNQRGGTDHAWGGHHVVLGAAVNNGFYGNFPTLLVDGDDSTDSRGRWIPTTSVDQYGSTLAQWFGVTPTDLITIFPNLPNFPTNNLGFV